MDRILGGPERLLYRVMRVDITSPTHPQDWKAYAKSLILFSLAGWLLLYFLLRTQTLWDFTGLNPLHFHSAPANVTFNTTSSFLTNTNWQYYGGETTMSYFSQMAGLAVQNFLSAAVGISVAIALIRGIVGRNGKSLGNFWQDLVRTVLYVLLPLSILLALVLVWQGSIQTFTTYLTVHGVTGLTQSIARGPGGLPGGDQGARHQRRRLLQRQLGPPIREPDGVHQPRRDAGRADHPRRLGVLLRAHGRPPPPGLRHLLDDDDHVPGRGDRLLHRRGPRLPRPARRRPAHRGLLRVGVAATWRARSSASGSPGRRSSTSSPRSPPAAPSTAPSSPSPASAAPCRSPTCRRARSSSAASAPACTRSSSTSCSRCSSAA